jgi:hypothetical protein
MFSQRRTYFIASFVLLFAGCASINTNENTNTNTNINTVKQKPIIKKTIIKKPIVKKRKKKIYTYKFCNKHTKIMSHASEYITEEFKKGYFNQKDIKGAKAQLFLIESKSQSIFAKNINNAIKSYNSQYSLAKKNRCNLSKFKITPIKKVKNTIKLLEKDILNKENKK